MSRALLLIDTQEDFLARAGLTPDRATLAATIAVLLEKARAEGWPVIHIHSRVSPDGYDAMPHRRDAPETVAGTSGAEPPPELAPAAGEPLLFKRFFSAFDGDQLTPLLEQSSIDELVLAGVHAHACIRDTVNDAYRLGYKVILPDGAIASYDPAHAAISVDWQSERSARVVPVVDLVDRLPVVEWSHRDPCDQRNELGRVRLTSPGDVAAKAAELADRAPLPIEERRQRLTAWHEHLQETRDAIRDALVRDVAKPVRDAAAEIEYGLALLSDTIERLSDEEADVDRLVKFRPRGVVGIITPWNNPFAIPLGKIAPAIGYGDRVLWKPALAGSSLAQLIARTACEAGLDDWIGVLTGDSGTGEAIVADPRLAALAFTGSAAVGRKLIARAGVRSRPVPVQAELGGSNAAIVDESADLEAAAADLAHAMFSFSGQRCTAIRRIILVGKTAAPFVERLVDSVQSLVIGRPDDPSTDIGPLIDAGTRQRLLDAVAGGVREGGRLLCGGGIPENAPVEGCWMQPTLVDGLGSDHVLNQQEWFGPIATIQRAASFEEAIRLHNCTRYGLLGALYSTDERHIGSFTAEAQAGILSINRARPPFSSAGPFNGWKDSGFGIPEHGRWNRDFYTEAQVHYRA